MASTNVDRQSPPRPATSHTGTRPPRPRRRRDRRRSRRRRRPSSRRRPPPPRDRRDRWRSSIASGAPARRRRRLDPSPARAPRRPSPATPPTPTSCRSPSASPTRRGDRPSSPWRRPMSHPAATPWHRRRLARRAATPRQCLRLGEQLSAQPPQRPARRVALDEVATQRHQLARRRAQPGQGVHRLGDDHRRVSPPLLATWRSRSIGCT